MLTVIPGSQAVPIGRNWCSVTLISILICTDKAEGLNVGPVDCFPHKLRRVESQNCWHKRVHPGKVPALIFLFFLITLFPPPIFFLPSLPPFLPPSLPPSFLPSFFLSKTVSWNPGWPSTGYVVGLQPFHHLGARIADMSHKAPGPLCIS